MQKIIIVITSLLIVNIVTAQNIIFNWQSCLSGYESEEFDVYPHDIAKTDDGYFIVADYQVPTSAPPPQTYSDDIWLVKLDIDGNVVWDKFLGGSEGWSNSMLTVLKPGTLLRVHLTLNLVHL